MISDILFTALEEIGDNLIESPQMYRSSQVHIDALIEHMAAVLNILDSVPHVPVAWRRAWIESEGAPPSYEFSASMPDNNEIGWQPLYSE